MIFNSVFMTIFYMIVVLGVTYFIIDRVCIRLYGKNYSAKDYNLAIEQHNREIKLYEKPNK